MKKPVLFATALILFCGIAPMGIMAADSGDLVFPRDVGVKTRAEIGYENLKRDMEITSEAGDPVEKFDADSFFLRVHTDIGPDARFDLDAGVMDSGQSFRWFGGAGLRFLAYRHNNLRVGAFAQGRYAPNLKGRIDLPSSGISRASVDHDLIEADAGVLFGYLFRPGNQLTITPYAGPVLSIVRLSGDFRDPETGGKEDFKAREDNLFGAAVGMAFQFPGANSLRFEGRYFDEWSASVAAAMTF